MGVHLEASHTSKMELLQKESITLSIFTKISILDVLLGSK